MLGGQPQKVFGSGTRLYVTDKGKDTVIPPTLTAYVPSKKQSGKQAVLCQAKDMFPDLVKFTWKKKSNGAWTDVSEENFVEQRNEKDKKVIVTSMMIFDQNTAGDDYECTVTHEGGKEPQSKKLMEDKKEKKAEKSDNAIVNTTCPLNETLSYQQISGSSDQIPSQSLFVYAYGVMLMKNGLYCCAVFILLLKRKVGKKEESS
ncbi:hypothetical protein PO909_030979 [Leuciscus waleckii]